MQLLLGEGNVDDTLRSGMQTGVGNRVEPMAQLGIEIVEVAERAGEKEVLANIAIGPLDLALGFGPVRTAGLRLEAVVAGGAGGRSDAERAAPRAPRPRTPPPAA